MKVLVTGASGFLGTHVSRELTRRGHVVLPFDVDSSPEALSKLVEESDFIFHLAGVNRPRDSREFYEGNAGLTERLVSLVKEKRRGTPILFSSSIQATKDNDYGKSKKMAEDCLFQSGLPVYVYRLSNLFGRGGRPNYNSAAATFCFNIAHDFPVTISDPKIVIGYQFVEDVARAWADLLESDALLGSKEPLGFAPTYPCSLGNLVSLLKGFKDAVASPSHLPIIHDDFERKLFKTFCWYLSDEGSSFNYSCDARGGFEEIMKSSRLGQISENITRPGEQKGGHYHTRKEEIFYTVQGKILVRLRNLGSQAIEETVQKGPSSPCLSIPPNATHDLVNVGTGDALTLMWISEIYSPDTADTYREPVELR
ncbi:MAG: NAD-dependent epimerase/dehydratase family protein [Candidatus Enteromonas sp.]